MKEKNLAKFVMRICNKIIKFVIAYPNPAHYNLSKRKEADSEFIIAVTNQTEKKKMAQSSS